MCISCDFRYKPLYEFLISVFVLLMSAVLHINPLHHYRSISFTAGSVEIDCVPEPPCVSSPTCDFEAGSCCYASQPLSGTASWSTNIAGLLHITDHTLESQKGKSSLNTYALKYCLTLI